MWAFPPLWQIFVLILNCSLASCKVSTRGERDMWVVRRCASGCDKCFFADYQPGAPGGWDNLDILRLSDCRLDKVTKYVEGMFQTPWDHRQKEGWIVVGRPRKISDWMNAPQWQILDPRKIAIFRAFIEKGKNSWAALFLSVWSHNRCCQ